MDLLMMKTAIVLCAGGLLLLAVRCGGYTAPTLPGPAISSFSAAQGILSAGASTTLTAAFSNGAGVVDQGVGPVRSGVPVTVQPAATTTYTLTASAASGAYVNRSLTVTVVPAPIEPVIVPPSTVEPGMTGLQASVPVQAGCSYLWTINKGGGTLTAGATSATVTFDAARFGELTLTCTVTNQAGTKATSAPVTFLLGGPTVESFSADPETINAGESSVLSYQFSGGTGVISAPGQPDLPVAAGSSSVTVTPAASTTYTFTVSDSKGEAFSSDPVTVTVVTAPTITLFAASPGIIGAGTSTQLIAMFDAGPGGTATVDQGVGSVASGAAVATGTLEGTTSFTLTVSNGAGVEATAVTRVLVGSLAVLAGAPSGEGSLDGPVAGARYRGPAGMVLDGAGNLLVADTPGHTIRAISPEQEVSTLAGAEGLPGTADGVGSAARFDLPAALALDPASGNVLVADAGNHAIRMLTPGGAVTTLAGSPGLSGSADGVGPAARFNGPAGIVAGMDAAGPAAYVADTGNDTIRRLDLGTLMVTTLAGTAGVPGNHDGGPGVGLLDGPAALAWIGTGTGPLYLADAGNNAIRLVLLDGTVTTVAGNGAAGSADGQGAAARFEGPRALALGSDGFLYVADTGNSTLRRMALGDATVTTLAGTAGDPGAHDGVTALFNLPQGLALDAAGLLSVADTGNTTLRRLDPTATAPAAATWSGTPGNPGHADGPAAEATLRKPRGAVRGASGNLYLADSGNHSIRAIAPDGTVTTLAGAAGIPGFSDGTGPAARFRQPTALAAGVDALGQDYLIVADTGNHSVRMVLADGTVTTLAGTGTAGSRDSAAGPAQFNGPAGVALDAGGNVLVADTGNQTLRRIAASGYTVTTLAGTAGTAGALDGAEGPGVSFRAPAGLAVAANGTVYVADSGNHTIRMLAGGQVSTLAGAAGQPGSTDGTGTAARLNGPSAITLDASGDLLVTNTGSSTVCVITPAGLVSTIIGSAAASGTVPGPLPARISPPYGITLDPDTGDIFITIDDALMKVDFTQ
jgi:sugar lactone lactonase YvrE